jgi:hypothetical protein
MPMLRDPIVEPCHQGMMCSSARILMVYLARGLRHATLKTKQSLRPATVSYRGEAGLEYSSSSLGRPPISGRSRNKWCVSSPGACPSSRAVEGLTF